MNKEIIHFDLPRGRCPVHLFDQGLSASAPVVVLFMDIFGPRPTLFSLAEKWVAQGYRVLLPDVFYAQLPYESLNPASVFSGGDDRERMLAMLASLSQAQVVEDVGALLKAIKDTWGAVPVGAVGYCMGGRLALTAATLDDSVVAAASLHGSNLAPEKGDSPHLHFKGIRAQVYVGVAGIDPTFGQEEQERLAEALRLAGVNHEIDVYEGAAHGFVMDDLPAFSASAAERHLSQVNSLFSSAFASAQ